MGAIKTYTTLEAAARRYGADHGITSRPGGWLYRNGAPFIQGWRNYGKSLVHRGVIERRGYHQWAIIPPCSTAGCTRRATEEISYRYRGGPERDTELVCTPDADGYERRPVLVDFTRKPLPGAGT